MHIDYSTLSAFADGDLDPALSEAVGAHLRTCAKCRAELQFIRSLGDGLRALQTPLAPRDACDGIWPEEREAGPSGCGSSNVSPCDGGCCSRSQPVWWR